MLLLLLACTHDVVIGALDPDATDPDAVAAPHEVPPGIVINEVMSRNDSTWMDADLSLPDWVEIYATGPNPVDLSRVSLSDGDDGGDLTPIGGGLLAPGEHRLLVADGGDALGHLPFQLDGDGDRLTLAYDGVLVDAIALGDLPGDVSLARFPDGGDWEATTRPTPGFTDGSHGSGSIDPSEDIFQTTELHRLDLTLSEAGEISLGQDPYTEVLASLGYRGVLFPQIDARLKGVYGSLRDLDRKSAFKLDLDAYVEHRIAGLKSLSINNMVQDPSYVHEYLAYRMFRAAGVPAPRVGYTDLWINGEYYGLYAWVESVDDAFLERWFAEPGGTLYEGAYGVDFQLGMEASFEYDEGADPDDRADLTAVATVLSGSPTDEAIETLDRLLDLPEFLRETAVETLIEHWDGYTTSNNYRVYHDPVTDRFTLIPWGTDQTFIADSYGPFDTGGDVLAFCLGNAGCTARYEEALLAMADVMEATPLEAEMDAILAWLGPKIEADPRGEHDAATRQAYIDATRDTIRTSPQRIRDAVAARHP